ncbi:peptidase inhibitor family I36 protein [Amycolatopsis sp. TRM77291]
MLTAGASALGGIAAHASTIDGESAEAADRFKRVGETGDPGKDCPAGYLCAWTEPNYRGKGIAIYGTESDWQSFPNEYRFIIGNVRSLYNNGNAEPEKDAVLLGRLPNYKGGTFVLCRRDGLPSLSEGRTDTYPGYGWDRQVWSNTWLTPIYC